MGSELGVSRCGSGGFCSAHRVARATKPTNFVPQAAGNGGQRYEVLSFSAQGHGQEAAEAVHVEGDLQAPVGVGDVERWAEEVAPGGEEVR